MRLLVALLLGALCALAVACGDSNDEGLFSAGRADRLERQLDAVADAVSNEDCAQSLVALRRLQDEVSSLPRATDPRLVRRLEEGVAQLQTQAAEDCQGTTEETPTVTEETPTVTEETPTVTEETPTETAPPDQPTETAPPDQPTETVPPEEPPPADDGTGGAQPGAGE